MSRVIRFVFVQITLLALLSAGVQPVFACGPFTIDPVFGFTRHGEYPLTDYAGGRIGIIPASYGRISLYVYFRYLNDLPFDQDEQKEVAKAIANRIGSPEDGGDYTSESEDSQEKSALSVWLEVSKSIRPEAEAPQDRERSGAYYTSYLACLDDAYLNAAETLTKRIKAGYHKRDIKNWVTGQDAVFSNCSNDGEIPAGVGGDAPEWLKKDRAYQSAAALFYSEKLPDARNDFEMITLDNSSPWSKISNYLVARTYIREASFVDSEKPGNDQTVSPRDHRNSLLASAAGKLNEIINDPDMAELHNPSVKLLGLVKYRLDPVARTVELAEKLSGGTSNQNIYNDLTDYIWLLDKIELKAQSADDESGDPDYSNGYRDWNYVLTLRDVPPGDRAADLTDWLITYQASDGFDHALERWKSTGKVHWLTAAITRADASGSSAEGLVDAADKLKVSSPAFATAMYHAIRISLESGKNERAARLTEKVFSSGFKGVPNATKNSFYAQRLDSAATLTEFLKYSKRTPTAFLWSDDFNEAGSGDNDYGMLPEWKKREMFGEDAIEILNTSVPLNVWLEAAGNQETPDYLRDFIVSSGWMRAFFLKDTPAEAQFSRLMTRYSRDYSPLMRNYVSARSARDREAAALISIGRYPVLEPSIPARWGRKTSTPTTIDSNRGNWWCLSPETEKDTKRPLFLDANEYSKGKAEYDTLRALGEGSTAFASRAVDFAKRNPRHQKTPEILHLAVRSTRYGCRDEKTGEFSKEAFDLLHSRYRNSVWTKKTPFWFG